MHIVIIPSWYPEYEGDIDGSFFREQTLALNQFIDLVGLIYPQMRSFSALKKGKVKSCISIEEDSGFPTYRFHFTNLTPGFTSLTLKSWIKKGEQLFLNYVKEHGFPDVLHAHSLYKAGFLAEHLSRKYNIPFVVTEHISAYAKGEVSSKDINLGKAVINNASACVAVSEEFRTLLNERFDTNKWSFIPNIVSDEFFSYDVNSVKSDADREFVFINVCGHHYIKRLDVLINAFNFALKLLPNIKLLIGGDGPETNSLKKLVNDLHLHEKVEFLGRLSRSQVQYHVFESDAFVLSSEYETFGVVVAEALALGKPVVSTKSGGPESIINDEVGLLVDKNSPELLAQAMIELYEQRRFYDPVKIRAYSQNRFSQKSVVKQLIKTYQAALANNE
ncbi:glycosyltransferase [Pseudoalteromonas rhizosphaerae]|uniref:glycosyltransferase n=1 Tax=Pseudoalteromonas rhizosphaerae TaxID=2518973 RepID=UPI0021486326|nr:glycosyltransferase [Pseudoalteromonas rhizosphaerae]